MKNILVTGGSGLIGTELINILKTQGHHVRNFDIKAPKDSNEYGNILSELSLKEAISNCDGIVHLAGVSRVITAQKHPELCWDSNYVSTSNIVNICSQLKNKPWLLYASSREVYGQQTIFPVQEDAVLQPMNIYAKSKVAAEKAVIEARNYGIISAIVRYSSVYGSKYDHSDRVVPAFCKAAVNGNNIYIEGSSNSFDFTHVKDVAKGTFSIIEKLLNKELLPPIHLTSGKSVSLGELANIIMGISNNSCKVIEMPPRAFDVSSFYGDITRANNILNWNSIITLEDGLTKLISDFKS